MNVEVNKLLEKESVVVAKLIVCVGSALIIGLGASFAETAPLKYTYFAFSVCLFLFAFKLLHDVFYIQKVSKFADKTIAEIKEHYAFLATNRNNRKNIDDLIVLDSLIVKCSRFIGFNPLDMPNSFTPNHLTSYSQNINELTQRQLQNIYLIQSFLDYDEYDGLHLHNLVSKF